MTKRNIRSYLTAGLIVVGLLLIVVSIILPTTTFRAITSQRIGIAMDTYGSVTLQGVDQIEPTQLKREANILKFDVVKTGPKSESIIKLEPSNGEVVVLENSELSFEFLDKKEVLITIRNGNILINKFGEGPKFWVSKDGRQLTARDFALSDDRNSELLRQSGVVLDESNQLSQAKIEEILGSRRNDFFRCYGQLIQRKEQAHGRVVISFEILSSGRVSKAEVSKSDIEDQGFNDCLSEVVLRTNFPRFNGQPISMIFPLKFE